MATVPKEDAARVPRPPEAAPAERGVPVAPAPPLPTRAQPQARLAPGTVIDGRYRVIRFLNQGGNGVVHEVEHLRTGRRLAMKSLVDDANAARLEQEARATALMKNPHVVKITDMGPSVDPTLVGPAAVRAQQAARAVPPYLVMELLEGQSLRELLDEAGQLPLDLTVNIALQVCECLAEAHGRSVIHRDLKPDNLFLVKSPWPGQHDVVVLDFGVMKIAGDGPIPKGSLTRTGSTVGTPYYMSLEQLRNSSNVDARADIYSLGVVLYECLAGRKPFVADTIGDLVYALCSGPPTPLQRLRPDLPPDIYDAVMRALRMNRDDRQPSMAELGAALMPHGHPAFSLWLRAGESAPVSVAPLASLREPLPSKPTGLVPPPAVAPAPPTPDEEGEGTTITAAAVNHLPEDPPTGEAAPTGRVPVPARDRDTPTEMFRGAFSGDRDTPTRAIRAPSLADADPLPVARPEAPMPAVDARDLTGVLPRPDDPERTGGGRAHTFRLDTMRFGASTDRILGTEARAVQGLAEAAIGPARSSETLRSAQGLPPAPPPEPPRFGPPPEPRATGQHPAAVLPAPVKPGWQQALDGALTSVGGSIEGIVKKVRAQPPPVQYAVLAAIGLVVLLVVVLFFVLIFR